MRVEWDSSLEIGDEVVDGQHRSLFALFNELADAPEGPGDAIASDALLRLCDYVGTHFACEEELMRSHGYPGHLAGPHQAQHRELTERTRELVLAHRAGGMDSIRDTVLLLEGWLVDHINDVDRALVDFIRCVDSGQPASI